MSTIKVTDEVAARLAAEAARRGVTVEALAAALAETLPEAGEPGAGEPGAGHRRRPLGFVSLGASTSGQRARHADEMLAEGFGES